MFDDDEGVRPDGLSVRRLRHERGWSPRRLVDAIEHALAPTLTGRLEYLYGRTLENRSFGLDDMHIIRAGAVYHFPR